MLPKLQMGTLHEWRQLSILRVQVRRDCSSTSASWSWCRIVNIARKRMRDQGSCCTCKGASSMEVAEQRNHDASVIFDGWGRTIHVTPPPRRCSVATVAPSLIFYADMALSLTWRFRWTGDLTPVLRSAFSAFLFCQSTWLLLWVHGC